MGIARIQCYLGRHVRSRGRARRMEYGWHSYCRRCGVEMIKVDGGEWLVVDEPDGLQDRVDHGGTDQVEPAYADAAVDSAEIEAEKARASKRFGRLLRRKH